MVREKRRVNIKISKRIVFQERTVKSAPLIVNTPLDKNGHPERDLEEVEARGKLYKGYHRFTRVILQDSYGNLHLREVLE